MKIVEMNANDALTEWMETGGGCYILEDTVFDHNIEEGDLIQCLSEWGTACYHVLYVEPFDEGHVGHGPNRVWIETAE